MKVGFNWCYIYIPVGVMLAALIGHCRFHLYEGIVRIYRRERYNSLVGEIYAICASVVLFVMLLKETYLGVLQLVLDFSGDDSAYPLFIAGLILVTVAVMYWYILRYTINRAELTERELCPKKGEDGAYYVPQFERRGKISIRMGDIIDILREEGINLDNNHNDLQIPDISSHVPLVRATKIVQSAKPVPQAHGRKAYLSVYDNGKRIRISSKPLLNSNNIVSYQSTPVRSYGNLALGNTASEAQAKPTSQKVVISTEEVQLRRLKAKYKDLPEEDRKLVIEHFREHKGIIKFVLSPDYQVPISFVPATETTPRHVQIHGIVHNGRVKNP